MKQFYAVNEGEYLFGNYHNKNLKDFELWFPVKDKGVDFLITKKGDYKKSVSLQVKYSKDHLPANPPEFKKNFRSCGFWNFGQTAIQKSIDRITVDFWVIIIHSFFKDKTDCIVIEPNELKDRFSKFKIEGKSGKTYFWITNDNKCFEARDIGSSQQKLLMEGKYNSIETERNFTSYLNNWKPVKRLLGVK